MARPMRARPAPRAAPRPACCRRGRDHTEPRLWPATAGAGARRPGRARRVRALWRARGSRGPGVSASGRGARLIRGHAITGRRLCGAEAEKGPGRRAHWRARAPRSRRPPPRPLLSRSSGRHHPARAPGPVQGRVLPAAAGHHVCQGEAGRGGEIEKKKARGTRDNGAAARAARPPTPPPPSPPPALQVAEAVDASILREWWPLAVNLVFSIALGALLGLASSLLAPPRLRRTVVVASSIGNINTIPLLVVASLCQSDDLMFFEVLGRECSTRGIAYVAVGMAIGSVFHHSIAFHMLKPPKGQVRAPRGGGGGGGPRGALARVAHSPPPPRSTGTRRRRPAGHDDRPGVHLVRRPRRRRARARRPPELRPHPALVPGLALLGRHVLRAGNAVRSRALPAHARAPARRGWRVAAPAHARALAQTRDGGWRRRPDRDPSAVAALGAGDCGRRGGGQVARGRRARGPVPARRRGRQPVLWPRARRPQMVVWRRVRGGRRGAAPVERVGAGRRRHSCVRRLGLSLCRRRCGARGRGRQGPPRALAPGALRGLLRACRRPRRPRPRHRPAPSGASSSFSKSCSPCPPSSPWRASGSGAAPR